MDTIKFTLSMERVQLLKEALDTQVRLIDAYINKDRDQEIRLAKFQHLQHEFETLLLAQ